MRRTDGIDTARLTIRPYRPDDLEALHRLWTDPQVRRYLWDDKIIPLATAAEAMQASIDSTGTHGYGHWALRPRGVEDLIGFCGFRVLDDGPDIELLYGLAPAYWGRGLATEASRALLSWGFAEYPWDRVLAITDAPNTASIRVMERLGMTFLKCAEHHGLDTVFYVMDRAAFERSETGTPRNTTDERG